MPEMIIDKKAESLSMAFCELEMANSKMAA